MSANEYEELAEEIDEDSRARRAAPLEFFCEVMQLMQNNDVDSFLAIWRTKALHYRWFANDALYCFDKVLAEPPPDLIDRLFKCGGFVLNHVTPSKITPYSHDEAVAWVRDLASKMRQIHGETAPR